MNFASYLARVEGKTSAQKYARVAQTWIAGGEIPPLPEDAESLQWPLLAYRRYACAVGLPEAPWPDFRGWEARSFPFSGVPPFTPKFTFAAEQHKAGVRVRCVSCDEVAEAHERPFNEEVARALSYVLIAGHQRTWCCGAWCEDLNAPDVDAVEDRDYHLLFLEPPRFRDWSSVQSVRGENGIRQKELQRRLAWHFLADEFDSSTNAVTTLGSCACGYMSVSGPDGGDCPCCGFAS